MVASKAGDNFVSAGHEPCDLDRVLICLSARKTKKTLHESFERVRGRNPRQILTEFRLFFMDKRWMRDEWHVSVFTKCLAHRRVAMPDRCIEHMTVKV